MNVRKLASVNAEMVGLIRDITDDAGLGDVPFLDDAVSKLVSQRDDARKALNRALKRLRDLREETK